MTPSSLQRIATGRVAGAAVFAWIALSAAFFALGPYASIKSAGEEASLLEERFGYSAADAHEWLESIGPDGRTAYGTFQLLDVGNALLTAIALTLVLAFSLGRLFGPSRRPLLLAYLPLAVGFLELVENTCLGLAVSGFPDPQAGVLGVASGVTMLKLSLGFCVFPMTALCLIAVFIAGIVRRRSSTTTATTRGTDGQ